MKRLCRIWTGIKQQAAEKKRWILLFLLAIAACGALGILLLQTIDVGEVLKSVETCPAGIREGVVFLLCALQIILAFLPGEPLELAAGYLFGSWMGTLICLGGSMLGTAVVFLLVKRYGKRIVSLFFKEQQIAHMQKTLGKRKNLYGVFLLFLIPGTPKDIMTYVVSLGNITLLRWLLLTTAGRIPSVITSTFLSGSLREENYMLAAGALLLTLALVVCGAWFYRRDKRRSAS